MPNPKDTAYERLKLLQAEAESASYGWIESGKLTEWEQQVQSALRRSLGENCGQLKALNDVRYDPLMFTSGSSDSVFHNAFTSGIRSAIGIVRSAVQEYEDYELEAGGSINSSSSGQNTTVTAKVFVVHGHDNEMKETVARFLENLGLEIVILHEQPSGGDTIVEKFERHADVGYAVVLLSPDDVGAAEAEPSKLRPRARQNVVLELGYFVGRLGRSRVCPVVRGKLELPSDYHGVVYVPFGGEEWKMHLVKELKHLGFEIDANKAFLR